MKGVCVLIEIKSLSCSYKQNSKEFNVLDNVSLTIKRGTLTAILGRNGSGKSTLAKHMNAILLPQLGTVYVDGTDTHDEMHIYDIREKVGMVFQNPDSQAVAAIVEDDTAFGPENLGLPNDEIEKRVDFALKSINMDHLRTRAISSLSGGQKQLVAIAGILAMRPKYMVFDESTSMLDPSSRKLVLNSVKMLKDKYNIGIIWITHYMDEAALAERIVITDSGKITALGTPLEIFSDFDLIKNSGLALPPVARLCFKLKECGYNLPKIALNYSDFSVMLKKYISGGCK